MTFNSLAAPPPLWFNFPDDISVDDRESDMLLAIGALPDIETLVPLLVPLKRCRRCLVFPLGPSFTSEQLAVRRKPEVLRTTAGVVLEGDSKPTVSHQRNRRAGCIPSLLFRPW